MGIFLLFILFLLVIPLLMVGSALLRLVFGVRTAFKPKSEHYFNNSASGAGSDANYSSSGVVGHSELGRKRLDILKNRATDVHFDIVEENS